MLQEVFCLDDGKKLYFASKTPLLAMQSLIYYLNLSHTDKSAKVELLGGGRTLSVVHNGKTYSCLNQTA
ncbi:hypothetical protein SDC9_52629 [bioreactor metagenome]|uniref:Uncharacterized protein n=1 Tax=bioreactor metagenome TaxID=1076179 RepID=A0A644WR69_9ZZZZ